MYFLCRENKGADQLRGYREADLRLCFRLCRLLVFPRGGSFIVTVIVMPTVEDNSPRITSKPCHLPTKVLLNPRIRTSIMQFCKHVVAKVAIVMWTLPVLCDISRI